MKDQIGQAKIEVMEARVDRIIDCVKALMEYLNVDIVDCPKVKAVKRGGDGDAK